jgi:hypothetical protein
MRTPSSQKCTRPCPTFGRPVHLGLSPSITARYFPSCPSDSTSRWTLCPPEYNKGGLQVGLGSVQLSPSCPFRPLLTFRFLRPARLRTPLLGYGAPHSSARGTSTLLNNALLSAHFRLPDQVRPTFVLPAIRSECRRCRSVARRTSVETPHGLAIRARQPHNQRTAGTRVARRS